MTLCVACFFFVSEKQFTQIMEDLILDATNDVACDDPLGTSSTQVSMRCGC